MSEFKVICMYKYETTNPTIVYNYNTPMKKGKSYLSYKCGTIYPINDIYTNIMVKKSQTLLVAKYLPHSKMNLFS